MKTTKSSICQTAKRLFETQSYAEVSMRNIADAAGIAIGNLTYHFPKKGDLISYMQKDLFENMERRMISEENAYSLGSLFAMIHKVQKNRNENSFLYRNMMDIIRDAPQIARNGNQFVEHLHKYLSDCFHYLKATNIMRKEISQEQYQSLAYTLVYMTQVWMLAGTLYDNTNIPRKELAEAITDLIYPYLTTEGIKQFSQLI